MPLSAKVLTTPCRTASRSWPPWYEADMRRETAVLPAASHEAGPVSFGLAHRRVLLIIGALMLGMLLAALDQTIVATAHSGRPASKRARAASKSST